MSVTLSILPVARVFDRTNRVYLDVKVSPKMPRAKSKAVSAGNGLIPQDGSVFGKPTMAESIIKRRSLRYNDKPLRPTEV